MSLQATDGQVENGDRMEHVTAVGASMFGCPVWPQAYYEFHVADRTTWVRDRLAEVV